MTATDWFTEATGDTREKHGRYKEVAEKVRQWLEIHKGETFELATLCNDERLFNAEARRYAAQELSRKVDQGVLEKVGKASYNFIDNYIKKIDWINAPDQDTLEIKFPYSLEDQTKFGFDGAIVCSPGDVIALAGQSNAGKTTFCQNFLWENMDSFDCTLMGNEYTAGKFKRRVSRMTWRDPLNGDGEPKFELLERRDRWHDIIRPDNINIIDWINITDNFYEIGKIIDKIQAKLRRGIVLLSLQKHGDKSHGVGGAFSEHLASLYLSMDFNRLTVVKAKEWRKYNPNKKVYGFEIVNQGTQFHNIRAIRKCFKCGGTGVKGGGKCDECVDGWVDDPKDDSCEIATSQGGV